MKLTRRERMIFAFFAVLYAVVMTIDQQTLNRWEWLAPTLAVALAWFINTDPERKAGY